ncbi:MAG: hypothetical protein AWU55_1918 [Halomonadaceae bacterium T82-2]|nr:MAG: hypothetical protein AWU55_1918 [Halomonadaceae bacterium T82-2]
MKMAPGYPRACGDRHTIEHSPPSAGGLSPRLRGSAFSGFSLAVVTRVIPAPAGIGTPTQRNRCPSPGYPRACGDRMVALTHGSPDCGLSPRLRGSDPDAAGRDRRRRVIPAPAGIGQLVTQVLAEPAGYPRACGDRDTLKKSYWNERGLSPRLRGSDLIDRLEAGRRRVIPAPAGIGPERTMREDSVAGYPRACGDRFPVMALNASTAGLSPRLRGSESHGISRKSDDRVIPAPAGIGIPCRCDHLARAGYPRACGDRHHLVLEAQLRCGLSPRLRGSGRGNPPSGSACRVIPAPAGIGRCAAQRPGRTTGYPRACGDRLPLAPVASFRCGLSPRLRGSDTPASIPLAPFRVIPAPAGIGPDSMTWAPHQAGYPRACGDRPPARFARLADCGLSPRLRGSVRFENLGQGVSRVIPAPAGIGFFRGCPGCGTPGYPRACGDREQAVEADGCRIGLSPRLRGSANRPLRRGQVGRGYPRACGDRSSPR